MDDKTLIVTLSIIFIVLQFLFKFLETKKNKEVIAAFKEGFASFETHSEVSNDTNDKIDSIIKILSFTTDDGRPLIYQSQTMIDTQNELVKMSHTVAQTQKMICTMMQETRKEINDIGEDIKDHAKECREKK